MAMNIQQPEPACLGKIRSPAGDCQTVTSYQEYVCYQLREILSFDEMRELMDYWNCQCDQLVDKIMEHKMQQMPKRKVR